MMKMNKAFVGLEKRSCKGFLFVSFRTEMIYFSNFYGRMEGD